MLYDPKGPHSFVQVLPHPSPDGITTGWLSSARHQWNCMDVCWCCVLLFSTFSFLHDYILCWFCTETTPQVRLAMRDQLTRSGAREPQVECQQICTKTPLQGCNRSESQTSASSQRARGGGGGKPHSCCPHISLLGTTSIHAARTSLGQSRQQHLPGFVLKHHLLAPQSWQDDTHLCQVLL